MITPFDDIYFMRKALQEAEKAFEANEIPVGAVIVANGQIIAKAHNLTERLNDVTAHAEMQAITAAANYLGGKYLKDCILYVTLEALCHVCRSLILESDFKNRIRRNRPNQRISNHGRKITPQNRSNIRYFGGRSLSIVKRFFYE